MQMKIEVFVFDERKPNFLVLLISIDGGNIEPTKV